MSSKYKFYDQQGIYVVTATVVGWADVFTRNIYRDIVLDSFRYYQQHQGLQIHARVLMTNHYHLICFCKDGNSPGMVLKNSKSFTAIKLIDAIIKNPQESRWEWLLPLLEKHGAQQKNNYKYQFWQHENQPILLDNGTMYKQRLHYLHENPVRAGFVNEAPAWLYSSTVDYYAGQKGLLDLVMLE